MPPRYLRVPSFNQRRNAVVNLGIDHVQLERVRAAFHHADLKLLKQILEVCGCAWEAGKGTSANRSGVHLWSMPTLANVSGAAKFPAFWGATFVHTWQG